MNFSANPIHPKVILAFQVASSHWWLKCIKYCATLGCSVVSNSLRPHGLQPARLLDPWGFSRQEFWSGLPCPPLSVDYAWLKPWVFPNYTDVRSDHLNPDLVWLNFFYYFSVVSVLFWNMFKLFYMWVYNARYKPFFQFWVTCTVDKYIFFLSSQMLIKMYKGQVEEPNS